jgi:hypothetical protein
MLEAEAIMQMNCIPMMGDIHEAKPQITRATGESIQTVIGIMMDIQNITAMVVLAKAVTIIQVMILAGGV